jgi:hypothetical protein
MSPRRDHEPVRSEMVRVPGAAPRFRPRCRCGWTGDPVDASEVVLAFDAHVEQTLRHPEVPDTDERG